MPGPNYACASHRRIHLAGGAATEADALGVHLVGVGVGSSLGGRQGLGGGGAVSPVGGAVEMGHLVQHAAGAVVVVSRALGGELGEAPEAVVGAGDDDVVRGDGVEEGAAVGAVAVGVRAGDLGGGGLHAGDVVVDGLDLGGDRGRLEPGGVVVGRGACSGGGGLGHGDGVGDGGLQGGRLRGGAGRVGDGTLLDAGVEGLLTLAGDVVPTVVGLV